MPIDFLAAENIEQLEQRLQSLRSELLKLVDQLNGGADSVGVVVAHTYAEGAQFDPADVHLIKAKMGEMKVSFDRLTKHVEVAAAFAESLRLGARNAWVYRDEAIARDRAERAKMSRAVRG